MKFLSLRLLLPAACLPFFTISASLSQTLLVTGKPVMETTVKAENLDTAAFAEWVDGREIPVSGADQAEKPGWALWTDTTRPGHSGRKFGDTNKPGVRHLRIGFKTPVLAGSVLVCGGGRLSVLRPEAVYPGGLENNGDWVEAARMENGEVSQKEVAAGELAVWVLPPGTSTRALRFSHAAEASDEAYAGHLEGAFISRERWNNLAPQALAGAAANLPKAGLLNNSRRDTFAEWDNLSSEAPAPAGLPAVSPQYSQRVMLTWPAPVRLEALNVIGAGFSAGEIQTYTGPADRHPRDAADGDWQSLGNVAELQNGYPLPLWPNLLRLREPVTTRALRLQMTAPTTEAGHSHLKGRTREGKRVWLGELMALQSLGDAPLQATPRQLAAADLPPPIPVPFKLDRPGFVTLVIEDSTGKRVRNLISETPFPAGDNVAWWDGTDDLGRDLDAARHGVYRIPAQFVTPGAYQMRGLVRGEIEPRYEFPVYADGNPAWETADKTGGWLTNHTPPQAALFVPAGKSPTGAAMVYLGSAVSEGGSGLAWVDLDGRKKGGRGWVGGNWTAAPHLASDCGPDADPDTYAYVGSTWTASSNNEDRTHGELRITALTDKGDRPVIKYAFSPPAAGEKDRHWIEQLGGIAAHNGLLVASLHKVGTLLFVDIKTGAVRGEAPVESPRGLAFDTQGRLLVLSGTKLLRYTVKADTPANLPLPDTLIADGLEDPQGLTLDPQGHLFVSDHGRFHQVKVFHPDGKFRHAIGQAGTPQAGAYDPLHLNHPAGLAIDANQRLWVTENDFLPKRVSVWNPDGTLWKAFYGPAKYGGGGTLDPQDKTRFYYADEARGAMEFQLDWAKGESKVMRVYYRPGPGDLKLPEHTAAPELALYHEGRRYFTNCYNSNPTGGSAAFLFLDHHGIAQPVAALGRAVDWPLLQTPAFAARLPAGTDWKNRGPAFLWSDANDDHQVQPDEVEFQDSVIGGVTVMPDLSLCAARLGEKAMRFAPTGFSPGGAPLYLLSSGQTLAEGVQPPASSGGDQVLAGPEGWSAVTLGMAPFAQHSLSGARNGQPMWSYPSLWPGLHAGHEAPAPDRTGQLIGTTRLLGGFVTPRDSDAGQIWAVNANMGTIHLFTADGLYVATVFEDKRLGKPWSMPAPERNMSLKGFTLSEENFWPTWSQTPDGNVYLMNGAKASLVRLDGLDSIRRIPAAPLPVTAEDLQKSQTWLAEREAHRQKLQGRGVLQVALRPQAPLVDGKTDDWADAEWVDIDKNGVAANFNSDSKPYDITAAVAIAGDRLYAAFRTGDGRLLQNSGEVPEAPFKTGGGLDLMLGVNAAADPARPGPVEGDLRLLVTMVKGQPKAVLYRPVVPGTKTPVPFSSPWRTITLDRADDISAQIQLAGDAAGQYEFSVPLATLGLKPEPGQSLRGDIGILRGNGTETTARVYWSNKATGITSDVPTEAMLTPMLWGGVEIKGM